MLSFFIFFNECSPSYRPFLNADRTSVSLMEFYSNHILIIKKYGYYKNQTIHLFSTFKWLNWKWPQSCVSSLLLSLSDDLTSLPRVPTACLRATPAWSTWSVRCVEMLITLSATSTIVTSSPSSTCSPTNSWSFPGAGRWSTTTLGRCVWFQPLTYDTWHGIT